MLQSSTDTAQDIDTADDEEIPGPPEGIPHLLLITLKKLIVQQRYTVQNIFLQDKLVESRTPVSCIHSRLLTILRIRFFSFQWKSSLKAKCAVQH